MSSVTTEIIDLVTMTPATPSTLTEISAAETATVSLQEQKLAEAIDVIVHDFPFALWETLYATFLATFAAILIGLPLGMLLVAGDKKGVYPMPPLLMKVLNVVINLLRSVPFVILMVAVIPLTRLIAGKAYGTMASIVPLVIAAFPFVARLVESSLREVNPSIIETAESMGAKPMQIMLNVMLPESVPSLITNFTLAITTIMGYTAMAGTVGGDGIGNIAMLHGYYRYNAIVMYAAVIVLVIITQVIQSFGTWLSKKCDKRLKN